VINAALTYDPLTDTLLVRVPGADGEGDVTLLAMDCKTLSADDKRRLAYIRDPKQAQRAPGTNPVTR
jgi:hypothetical protein